MFRFQGVNEMRSRLWVIFMHVSSISSCQFQAHNPFAFQDWIPIPMVYTQVSLRSCLFLQSVTSSLLGLLSFRLFVHAGLLIRPSIHNGGAWSIAARHVGSSRPNLHDLSTCILSRLDEGKWLTL